MCSWTAANVDVAPVNHLYAQNTVTAIKTNCSGNQARSRRQGRSNNIWTNTLISIPDKIAQQSSPHAIRTRKHSHPHSPSDNNCHTVLPTSHPFLRLELVVGCRQAVPVGEWPLSIVRLDQWQWLTVLMPCYLLQHLRRSKKPLPRKPQNRDGRTWIEYPADKVYSTRR